MHVILRAALGAVPYGGGAAVEVFQHFIQPPLERRRQKWMEDVGQKLQEMGQAGVDLERLQSDERFVSTVMHASQVALRTHQEERLSALRNVVLNAAKGQSSDEALEHMFLGFVDSLSDLHLRILKLSQSPEVPPGLSSGGLSRVLEYGIAELRGRRDVCDQFWKDLHSRGLVNTDGLHTMMTAHGLAEKRTTELGDKFLSLITESSQ